MKENIFKKFEGARNRHEDLGGCLNQTMGLAQIHNIAEKSRKGEETTRDQKINGMIHLFELTEEFTEYYLLSWILGEGKLVSKERENKRKIIKDLIRDFF